MTLNKHHLCNSDILLGTMRKLTEKGHQDENTGKKEHKQRWGCRSQYVSTSPWQSTRGICAGASWRTWSNPQLVCFSVSSSGPVTEQWAAAWWHWSSPWLHTAAPSSPSSSHSERQQQDQLGRGTFAAGVRSLGSGTWVFLHRLRGASPGRSAGDPLRLPPS